MLLAIDIGNTDITLGIFYQGSWRHVWRMPSVKEMSELHYGMKMREYFFEAGIEGNKIHRIVLSSVVPDLTPKISNMIAGLFGKSPLILGPELYAVLPLKILNPYEIGSDLVANAVAGWTKYQGNCIIVDFGTALTFTTIFNNTIEGVAILPGLKTAIRSLSQNTARLFEVPLEMPSSVLGKSTVHAIQAGVLIGYEGMVKYIVERINETLGVSGMPVVATGGLSSIIQSLGSFFDSIEPNLTLNGLLILGEQYS